MILQHVTNFSLPSIGRFYMTRYMTSASALSTSNPSCDGEVIVEENGNNKKVILNRPKAFNALNLNMIRTLTPLYERWERNASTLVILQGSGEKAFCSGGDVRAIYEAGKSHQQHPQSGGGLTSDFFFEEYQLNHIISKQKVTQVALLNGITMGGGVGLSVHGRFRVACEHTVFAMPETGIGLFCDVGGSFFLPRLQYNRIASAFKDKRHVIPQYRNKSDSVSSNKNSITSSVSALGMYLALTGAKLKGKDLIIAGIATHFVPFEKFPELTEKLFKTDVSHVNSILDSYNVLVGYHPTEIVEFLDIIERCFSLPTVELIIKALQNEENSSENGEKSREFAKKTLVTLGQMSPTSLKVVHRQLHLGIKLNYEQCFEMEYNMSQGFMRGHDFFEGVRAALVDKDKNPKWIPKTLEEVSEADVEKHFVPASDRIWKPRSATSSKN